jgi:peptidyl-Lys metalloendopeptidase
MARQIYTNFTEKQKTQVTAAFKDVRTLLLKANAALWKQIEAGLVNTEKAEQARYEKWFGAYTTPNVTHVRTRVYTIVQQLEHQDTYVQDDPASNTVAYILVAPGQNFGTQALNYADAQAPARVANPTIHIGTAFYQAPLLGKDSQTGTLIHELSHLICSTEDVPNPAGGAYADGFADTYGETNCKWLATNHPAQARHNADNYLFYCCSFDLR